MTFRGDCQNLPFGLSRPDSLRLKNPISRFAVFMRLLRTWVITQEIAGGLQSMGGDLPLELKGGAMEEEARWRVGPASE